MHRSRRQYHRLPAVPVDSGYAARVLHLDQTMGQLFRRTDSPLRTPK